MNSPAGGKGKLFPKRAARMRSNDFTGLLGASAYDDVGISYATPDQAHAEESAFWGSFRSYRRTFAHATTSTPSAASPPSSHGSRPVTIPSTA